MGLRVKIDSRKFKADMRKFPAAARNAVVRELGQGMAGIQIDARQHHRFKTQTGALERSVLSEVDPIKLQGTVWLEDGVARYGKYIHRGFKSWQADPFLYDAFRRKKKQIIKNIETIIIRVARGIF